METKLIKLIRVTPIAYRLIFDVSGIKVSSEGVYTIRSIKDRFNMTNDDIARYID